MSPDSAPVVTLTRQGAETLQDERARLALRDEFRRNHCARLSSFIEPGVLSGVATAIESGRFETKLHGDAARELCLVPDQSVGLLHFLVNDRAVFDLIEFVADVSPIRSFFGRVYRHLPAQDHFQDWHGDVESDRHVGLSVNLSRERYDGGTFEIRVRDTNREAVRLPNTGFGDAIVFRLREDLEHRVTALSGEAPKTAFAGWFRSEPDYLAVLRGRAPLP